MSVYLDANASEPLHPAARDAVMAALALDGNPSSIHAAGRAARRVLEDAREAVARRFGAASADVVFTSGGTEADALAIHALGQGRRLIVGATEHDAVRAAAVGAAILPVDGQGVADLAVLAGLLAEGPALVCLMLANNETGTVQPIAEAAALCRAAGALLHVDAAQAAGRMAVNMAALGADSLAISGHKMGGPKGAGALLVGPRVALRPLITGGGQERGWRGGTQAVPAIAGLGAAATEHLPDVSALRDVLETGAQACGAVLVGAEAPRLGNTACLALPGVAAQTQVMTLDLAGFQVSAGAACSSGKVARSHVAAFSHAYRAMAERLSRRAA